MVNILSDAKDLDLGHARFLLSEDERELRLYHDAMARLSSRLIWLKQWGGQHPEAQETVQRVAKALGGRITELQDNIQRMRQGLVEEARWFQADRAQMAAVRLGLRDLERRVALQSTALAEEAEERAGFAQLAIAVLLALTGVIVALLVKVTMGGLEEREKAAALMDAARAEAERVSRIKSDFLANMSHELRTPLNGIIGFADMIKCEAFGPIQDRRYVEFAGDIRDGGEHLLGIINDILDLCKADAERIDLREDVVDLRHAVLSCLRMATAKVGKAELAVSAAFPEDLPFVHADELRLKQILLNVMSNAAKFTPEGGSVTVEVSVRDDGVAVTVRDSGIGMAAADIERALEPFVQIDSGIARRHAGTGLGLPLAKRLTELHGGRLTLSSGSGRGTSVEILLPRERLRAAASLADARPPPG